MKAHTLLFTSLALAAAAPLAHAENKHPAYLHALADLREARAQLEKPNRASGTWDEGTAIREIDAAIKEIRDASLDDGKNLDNHPPVDAKLDWGGRLKHAEELVAAAYADVHDHEDNAYARGLRDRALKHMSLADGFIKKGMEDARTGEGAGAPGEHPAYLHALSDLRDARALLERPQDVRPSTAWDEHRAIELIDQSIKDIKDAAIDDGKNMDDHAPIDANLDWGGRLKKVDDLLTQAYQDVDKHEDNKAVHGLKMRALKNIGNADQFVKKGMKVRWERVRDDHDRDHDHDRH
jgi:hypothetical protein